MTTKKSGPAWWRAFGLRPKSRHHDSLDFGDMGTVFGLEATLGATENGKPAESRATPSDAAQARQRSAIDRLNGRSVR